LAIHSVDFAGSPLAEDGWSQGTHMFQLLVSREKTGWSIWIFRCDFHVDFHPIFKVAVEIMANPFWLMILSPFPMASLLWKMHWYLIYPIIVSMCLNCVFLVWLACIRKI
jgi:hypothetical protein